MQGVYAFAACLSHKVTLRSSTMLIPATVTCVALYDLSPYDMSVLIESFHVSGEWAATQHRIRRSVDRYSDRIATISIDVDASIDAGLLASYVQMKMSASSGEWSGRVDATSRPARVAVSFAPCSPEERRVARNVPRLLRATYDPAPIDLRRAIDGWDGPSVMCLVAAGVSMNTVMYDSSMTEVLILTISEVVCSLFGKVSPAVQATFEWLRQASVDWNIRTRNGSPLLHRLVGRAVSFTQHLLPWDRIDVASCNDSGDNVLHVCVRYQQLLASQFAGSWMEQLVDSFLLHGSGVLTMCINKNGKRPSEIGPLDEMRERLRRAENGEASVVAARLSDAITVTALVHIVMGYYANMDDAPQ